MRYCRIRVDGRAAWGRVVDERIELLSGSPLDGGAATGGSVPVAGAEWLPPIVPPVFYAVGMNYRRHIEHAAALGNPAAVVPQRPEVGYRANNALTGHGRPIVRPAGLTGRFEAEPELVAVIGRRLRRCSADEARAGVFGWTIGNDVSARDWQRADRTFWRAKNSDTFKPMGPWIETDVEPLAADVTTTVTVDGETVARFGTGDMVFDPYDYVCEISRHITLSPGDVLWMGADGSVEMRPGTTIAITITGIGTLSNPVTQEPPPDAAEERR